jgi:m7GpppX diphosphatase
VKLDEEGDCGSQEDGMEESRSDDSLFPFHEFATDRILFTDPRSKSICVLGSCVGSGERGIIVAEKQPLTESTLPHLLLSSSPKKKFQNDVYSQYLLDCKQGGLGEIRVTTVYPATDKHVQKYESQKRRFVLETPASYEEITKPFAEKQSLSLNVRVRID